MTDDTAELRQLAKKPWRGACTECRDRLWFGESDDEVTQLVRQHVETHLRIWAEPERKPAEPAAAPARTEINNTSATTERRWAPHVTAPATPFGFASRA